MKNLFDFVLEKEVLVKLIPALLIFLICVAIISSYTEQRKQLFKIHSIVSLSVLGSICGMWISDFSFFIIFITAIGIFYYTRVVNTISFKGQTAQERFLYHKKTFDGYFMIDWIFLIKNMMPITVSFFILFAIGVWARKFYFENDLKLSLLMILSLLLFQSLIFILFFFRRPVIARQ
jgi:hypothetical protein